MIFQVAKLVEDAIIPTRKHPQDAGADFYAVVDSVIPPLSSAIIRTGITVKIPEGYVGFLWPKGRSAHLVGAGVVDEGYQGEILVKVVNPSASDMEIEKGMPICQMVLVPALAPVIQEVPVTSIHTESSSRGKDGGIVKQLELFSGLAHIEYEKPEVKVEITCN